MAENHDRLPIFAYVNAEHARRYRAVMSCFTAAKANFRLHLRPRDIERLTGDAEGLAGEGLEAALTQLCEWGNLEAHPDTAEVESVEEFYRARYLYQMTAAGEAAERALAFFENSLREGGALQSAALEDIHSLLGELLALARQPEPDAAKVHRTLQALCARFEGLTERAQTFIASLQRTIDLSGIEVEALLEYKEALIEYLERFIGELALTTPEIAGRMRAIEQADARRREGPEGEAALDAAAPPHLAGTRASAPVGLLELAAERDHTDELAPDAGDIARTHESWQARWQGLRAWFLDDPAAPSQSSVLRARARSAIPALLTALAGVHDQRTGRSDRASDFKTLARWFAQADDDAQAHRLWRAAFALAPSRHLSIDAASLDAREEHPLPARTSWLDAPPLMISPRLRQTGRQPRARQTRKLVDLSREKALLAQAAAEEARQVAEAQRRLARGERMRLSQVGTLDPMEFGLFLELLGEALSRRLDASAKTEASSQDGVLRIVLEPTGDDTIATIATPQGRFHGQDHLILIERSQPDDLEWEAQDWESEIEGAGVGVGVGVEA